MKAPLIKPSASVPPAPLIPWVEHNDDSNPTPVIDGIAAVRACAAAVVVSTTQDHPGVLGSVRRALLVRGGPPIIAGLKLSSIFPPRDFTNAACWARVARWAQRYAPNGVSKTARAGHFCLLRLFPRHTTSPPGC